MPSAYEGTDIISYLQRKYIIRQRRISYRVSDISLNSAQNSRTNPYLSANEKDRASARSFSFNISYTKYNPIFISISINTCATETSAPPNIIIPAIIAYATTIRPITMGRSKNTIIAAIAVKIFLYV